MLPVTAGAVAALTALPAHADWGLLNKPTESVKIPLGFYASQRHLNGKIANFIPCHDVYCALATGRSDNIESICLKFLFEESFDSCATTILIHFACSAFTSSDTLTRDS